MASAPSQQFPQQDNRDLRPLQQGGRAPNGAVNTGSAEQRVRNEESWVEISSQPSSSSLSSFGDEIVTTGLRVRQDPTSNRRRRLQQEESSRIARQTSTSSQEEYEESESEEDHVMTSSNEHVHASFAGVPLARPENNVSSDTDSDDDDENATALGRVKDEPAFTPQPNAFSHPPSASHPYRREASGSYFDRQSYSPQQQQRSSYPGRSSSRPRHSPYSVLSPAHQPDHDAALRASLTTLLSCAAAARGLSKRNQTNVAGASTSPRPEFTGFRLVPESDIMGASPTASHPQSPSRRARPSPSVSSRDGDKGKRKATSVNKAIAQSRATKKKKTGLGEENMISPTLLTWVVSAGVVVLVSVVGFSAGYVIGKEVGRQEALSGLSEGASCGKQMARGPGELRRLRWGNARSIVA
ncbi:MAG: hypothetical protein M1818_002118 [Claussenomyces sp. TS43310]|nr:MAG: hypothetical protein M1818_002118 [Claussenomyces sp. TS43310]